MLVRQIVLVAVEVRVIKVVQIIVVEAVVGHAVPFVQALVGVRVADALVVAVADVKALAAVAVVVAVKVVVVVVMTLVKTHVQAPVKTLV